MNFERHKANIHQSIGIGLPALIERYGDELMKQKQWNLWNSLDRDVAQEWLNQQQLPFDVKIDVYIMDNNRSDFVIRKMYTQEIIFIKQLI